MIIFWIFAGLSVMSLILLFFLDMKPDWSEHYAKMAALEDKAAPQTEALRPADEER